ncbi:DUF58 domain-containing protein [Virgibacillus ihumii]|uniref:DUF58 domain-containing protein n=1 Tax=Virgibacillus ihumii TaxID=2686091 RepID=UPI00157C1FF0|nr:DUF58 domain-containing protein [Virgibacillus ihumii]
MNWHRTINVLFAMQLLTAAAVLFFISLYQQKPMLVLLAFLIVLVIALPHLYLKRISNTIHLANPEQQVKLFSGQEDGMHITLENRSRLPIFSGKLLFSIQDNIMFVNLKQEGQTKKRSHFSLRFNLAGKQKADFKFQASGLKRGVGRVSGINMTIRDLLGVGTLQMGYDSFFHSEVIVFPELRAVGGLHQLKKFEQGVQPMQFSLFEDVTASIGSRGYAPGDPFNRIHWKASAKSTQLQTKQFEKTTGMEWMFVLNLSRDRIDLANKSDDLERNISSIAYMCKYATARGIPYGIFTNIKVRGQDFIMQLKPGEGRNQLSRALELLARINFNSITVKQEMLFAYVDRVMFRPPVVILFNCGRQEQELRYYQKWEKRGAALFEVEHKADASYIVKASRKREAIS